MIAPDTVADIRRLLAEDVLGQREIARRMGVCRSTVGAIAAGRRLDRPAKRPPEADLWETSDPPERCSTCGGLVYMPCMLCRLRKEIGEHRKKSPVDRTAQAVVRGIALELRPDHRSRYEDIRERRRQEEQRHSEFGIRSSDFRVPTSHPDPSATNLHERFDSFTL
jgi:hypothetical protein